MSEKCSNLTEQNLILHCSYINGKIGIQVPSEYWFDFNEEFTFDVEKKQQLDSLLRKRSLENNNSYKG
mgnify:CR=1 FL=1